jgi:hypothetical protein
LKNFLIDIQYDNTFNEIFLEKVIAGMGKGCTFAPAFGREEGLTGGISGVEFFDSLRPAQYRRGVSRAGQGTL